MKYVMPLQEAIDRIDRIKKYRDFHARAGQPHHALDQAQVEAEVVSWGHDPKLAAGAGRIVVTEKTASKAEI